MLRSISSVAESLLVHTWQGPRGRGVLSEKQPKTPKRTDWWSFPISLHENVFIVTPKRKVVGLVFDRDRRVR